MVEKLAKNTDPARYQLLCKVAWLYYHNEDTQAEIAEKLGLSRVTVNRMIREARESGLVEIKVKSDLSPLFDLAQRLVREYSLRDAVCTFPPEGATDLRPGLAEAAAQVIGQRLREGMTVGIGIGRTIASIPDYFQPPAPIACRFIGLTGGLDLHQGEVPHTFDTLSRLANLTGGTALYIPTPSYLKDSAARKLLSKEQAVKAALEAAAGSQMAVFSVGAADYSALLYEFNHITSQELEELRACEAVGDVLGLFFDRNGHELQIELNRRIIGLHLDQLKRIPLKIMAAGGENKREAIRIALKSRVCDILVTDAATAEWLLKT
jgi:DNA-binding transcriptional regulator LsrR (DeoR family)